MLCSPISVSFVRVRTGCGKFLIVAEIDNAIFQDLENFGKGTFFRMATEKFGFLLGKVL